MDRSVLLDRFRGGYSEVERAIAEIGPEPLDRSPAPGEWSPRQVVHHLADSEAIAYVRLRRLIAEDHPLIPAYDEGEYARRLHYERPVETSLALLKAVREASLQLLESLTEEEWTRSGTHSESGPYSVEHWLEIYASHPHDHARQIREAALKPAVRGAGN
jgi:hypothetical protein